MNEKLFEIELEIIKKSSFSYLLGYYQQALTMGLKNSWRKTTDKQAKKILFAILDKIEAEEKEG